MSGTEWFILIVIVIVIPLVVAVAVTLWTLEMARQRNKRNRGDRAVGMKRQARRQGPSVERQVQEARVEAEVGKPDLSEPR